MKIIVKVVTTNSKKPTVVIDINSLEEKFQKKIKKSLINKSDYLIVTHQEVAELFDKQIINPYPCLIEGEIEFVSD